MALDNKVVTTNFKEMLTNLEDFESQKKAAGQPAFALTAEQIAEKMSDWIVASSIQSTVHFMKVLPTKPESGKIYLLKTGQYIIYNPNGKPFTGSLLDISSIPEQIADNETKKLQNPAAIEKLQNQLADLKSNRKNPEFIVQVVKITTKLGHNPLEAAKQNAVQNKCLLVIHPDKLSAQDNPLKKYLVDGRTMADNEPVAPDFYMKTVNATLALQSKPPAPPGKLLYASLIVMGFLIGLICNVLLNGAIAGVIYLAISMEYAQAYAIWAACDILKTLIILPIIKGLSSLLFSQKHAEMIAQTCGMIISGILIYQFIMVDFVLSAIATMVFAETHLENFFKAYFTPPVEQPENAAAQPQNAAAQISDLEHSKFIANAFKKAQQKAADKVDDVPPPAPPVKEPKPFIGAAFKNDKDKKKADASNKKNNKKGPAAAKAANDEKPAAKKRRSPSPRAACPADDLD